MRLLIGEYENGRLEPGFHETGDNISTEILQELKGHFTQEYRTANITLTEQQLLAAATPEQDIIQAIHTLEQLDHVLSRLGRSVTDWHRLHHPVDTTEWTDLVIRELENEGVKELNSSVAELQKTRDKVIEHIEKNTEKIAPNTSSIAGAVLTAKLIEKAGSLKRLASLPSSTVQILGAEKALFRSLKSRSGRPPKHGIILSHSLLQESPIEKRGFNARKFASAISLAAKMDAFGGENISEEIKNKLRRKLQ